MALFFIGLVSSLTAFFNKKTVDFYFLFGCEFDKSNMSGVINFLENKGYKVKVDLYSKSIDRIFSLAFGYIPWNIPCYLARDYSIASYINNFSPKLVVFIDNIEFKSTILRHVYHIKTLNIAHGVRINDWDHSYIDFDYYFVFGESSLNHMRKNKNLFGSTKAVITGSYFVDGIVSNRDLQKKNTCFTVLFLSQWLHPRVAADLSFSRDILLSYAKINSSIKIVIKLHPLEDENQKNEWNKIIAGLVNVEILEHNVSLKDAIEMSSVAVSAWSNALVVATWLGCPIISIDRTNYARNNLDIDEYFPVVEDVDTFSNAIYLIKNNNQVYMERCKEFSRYHFGDCNNVNKIMSRNLIRIIQGGEVPYVDISENNSW